MHFERRFAVKTRLSAFVDPSTFGLFDAVALPFFNKATLHLGNHAQDSQYDVAHLATGRDMRVQDRDKGSSLLALVDEVENVASVAAESVEPGDDQLIARPGSRPESSGKPCFVAGGTRSAGNG